MVKLIYQWENLSRRMKLVAATSSLIIGSLIAIGSDLSLGFALDDSVRHLVITGLAGLFTSVVYGAVIRYKKQKNMIG